jgi:hypothetical protein
MIDSGLRYFTHEVDGAVYGAWYRIVSSTQIEVIGVGMLEPGEYAGYSPESSARSILENFVRSRMRMGAPVPSLTSHTESNEDVNSASDAQPSLPNGASRSRA